MNNINVTDFMHISREYPEIAKEGLSTLQEKDLTQAETLDSANQGMDDLKKENQQLKTDLANTLRLIHQHQIEKGQLNPSIIYLTDLNRQKQIETEQLITALNQKQIENEQLNRELNRLMSLGIQQQNEIAYLETIIEPLKKNIDLLKTNDSRKDAQLKQSWEQLALMSRAMKDMYQKVISKEKK